MAWRGRRQVLQLDDVSSTHSPIRPRSFAPVQSEEVVQTKKSSNPLLSLVGYASDDSSDEDSDDSETTNRKAEDSQTLPPQHQPPPPPAPSSCSNNIGGSSRDLPAVGGEIEQPLLEIPLPAEAEPPVQGPEPPRAVEPQERAEADLARNVLPEPGPELEPAMPAVESMLDIPLPESCGPPPPLPAKSKPAPPHSVGGGGGGGGVGMESELANFFAEIQQIESISAETAAPSSDNDKEEAGSLPLTPPPHLRPADDDDSPAAAADSSEPPEPPPAALGFIPRPDASLPLPEERRTPPPPVEEKPKSSSSSTSNAYRSMFVKGAPEFVRKDKEEEKKENGVEVEEELPEEPVSEWQMVQDEGTGYYYYWNMVSNQVTWEIPPSYTQYLLLFKEYQERIAAIPEDKLNRMKEKKKEKEKEKETSARESSPAPATSTSTSTSSKPKKEKKHKRDKHRKEKSESSVQIGPQLPPVEPPVTIGPQLPPPLPAPENSGDTELKATADQSEAETTSEVRNGASPRPSLEEGKEGRNGEKMDWAVDSTSVSLPQDVEAFFDEALSAMSEGTSDSRKEDTKKADSKSRKMDSKSKKSDSKKKADSKKAETSTRKADTSIDMFRPDEPVVIRTVVTSSSVVEASAVVPPSMDVTTSGDTSKPVSADSSKSSSPAPAESDPGVATTTIAATSANTSVVSSSSVVSSILTVSKESKDLRGDSGEGVVTNSGVNEGAGVEHGEEDDMDMDFENIDDLDRALEKALEKKLEKKKAELEKLQNGSEDDVVTSDSQPLSSSTSAPASHSDTTAEPTRDCGPAEADWAVSSSVRNAESPSPKAAPTRPSRGAAALASTSTASRDTDSAADSSDVKPAVESPRLKRSAAESSTKEDSVKRKEPVAKKARLVAYDGAETDEESVDASEEVSTTPGQSGKSSGDVNSLTEVAPTPPAEIADNVVEIEEMANTACAKLAFLEVTVEGLTPLQTSLIALQTRMTDWQNGGLSGVYFHQRLREVNDLLTLYESRAVPEGWTCQWDSDFRRYFYINGSTGQTQWEYPEEAATPSTAPTTSAASAAATDEASSKDRRPARKGKSSKKKKSSSSSSSSSSSKRVMGPELPPPLPPSSSKTSTSRSAVMTSEEGKSTAVPQVDGSSAKVEGRQGGEEVGLVSAAYQEGMEEDLDGVAMDTREDSEGRQQGKTGGEDKDSQQPTTSTADPPAPGPHTQQGGGGEGTTTTTSSSSSSSSASASTSALQALFPGEPLPPGTELLLGLPPPPPPPLPPADEAAASTSTTTSAATGDTHLCADYDDSSDSGSEKNSERGLRRRKAEETASSTDVLLPNLDPDIDGEEMVDEDEDDDEEEVGRAGRRREEEEEGEVMAPMVVDDPAVISKPPQLRFPPAAVAAAAPMAYVSSSSSSVGLGAGVESSTVSSHPVLSSAPVLNVASGHPLPDSVSSGGVPSPGADERRRSPAPSHEPSSSSSSTDHHRRDKTEKHKKKKKEKLGSHTMSLKKKGVSTMVQTWQKVQKEVEEEERANQRRQRAIRQQLEELKKGNS